MKIIQFDNRKNAIFKTSDQEHYLPGYDKLVQIEAGAFLSVSSQENPTPVTDLPNPTDIFEDFLPQTREKSAKNDFKETTQIGKIGLEMVKRYMSLKFPFYIFVLYLLLEVSSMAAIAFGDIWLKLWLEDVKKFTKDCSNSSLLNGTDCNPQLMDLPNAPYYRNVYYGTYMGPF